MNNKNKHTEYLKNLRLLRHKGLNKHKPSVCEMEELKYSDSPLHRMACAFIEVACEVEIMALVTK